MPTGYQIFPQYGLVLIKHTGLITAQESMDAIESYTRHPDAAPGQKHLVDCSDVTDYERDWSRIMSIQARMAEVVPANGPEALLVLFAPEGVPREVAVLICKSWDGNPGVVPRITATEEEALSLVGLPFESFAELTAPA